MREYFKFYRNFYEAIETLGEKSQLKLYKSVMKLYFNRCKNVTELDHLCSEIETKLAQNRNVYGTFLAIKPLVMKSARAYVQNDLKGTKKSQEKMATGGGLINNKEINNKEINNNKKEIYKEKENTVDPYSNSLKTKFVDEYKKIYGQSPILTSFDCQKLVDLAIDIDNFEELIPIAISRLKKIKFDDINYKPGANWLLKENNFAKVVNGEFEKEDKEIDGWNL